ncbi:hypothetical protein JRQ81_006313 [Phrynocephalus forsythii]|uniref:Uncharacterized protein n=1 Tax=Phrynocephalus forsythii TaxID=171643 RepID=A0A9Q0XEH1_9SAUR|nr:hypothetical protein JRQ81_006313 [Phrynocephalus forsythii]
MAKEGAEKAEETEQMIEPEAATAAASAAAASTATPGGSSSSSSSPRAADAKEMRAVVLSAFGGLNKLRVSKKVMPEPQEGEVKIRVKAWSSIISLLLARVRRTGGCSGAAARERRARVE